MHIVIYGAREREEVGDLELVNALLVKLQQMYGTALVVFSAATDKGIGKFVKDRCQTEKDKYKFVDVSVKIFGSLPPARIAQIFKARNAPLVEVANELYVFDTFKGKGITEDLILRAINSGLPVFVFKPGDKEPMRVFKPKSPEYAGKPLVSPENTAQGDADTQKAQEKDV